MFCFEIGDAANFSVWSSSNCVFNNALNVPVLNLHLLILNIRSSSGIGKNVELFDALNKTPENGCAEITLCVANPVVWLNTKSPIRDMNNSYLFESARTTKAYSLGVKYGGVGNFILVALLNDGVSVTVILWGLTNTSENGTTWFAWGYPLTTGLTWTFNGTELSLLENHKSTEWRKNPAGNFSESTLNVCASGFKFFCAIPL